MPMENGTLEVATEASDGSMATPAVDAMGGKREEYDADDNDGGGDAAAVVVVAEVEVEVEHTAAAVDAVAAAAVGMVRIAQDQEAVEWGEISLGIRCQNGLVEV